MSKKNLIRPQYEEFWDDCLKLTPKKNIKLNEDSFSKNKSTSIKLQKNCNNKIIFRQKNNSIKSKNNHQLIKKVLTTEESISKSIEKRKQKQINILTSIYNNHILKQKKVQKETSKLKENLIIKEKKDCTFKPKYYTKHRSISEKYFKNNNYYQNKKIYEREQDYKDKKYNKLKLIKHEKLKYENKEYPFQPEIKYKNIGRILYGNNFWEELANNLSNEIFLRRYKKAREEDIYKKKKMFFNIYNINDSINEDNNNKNKNKKIHKSISQKNSLLYRQTLHNYLLEYETNDEDNVENDKEKNNINSIKIVKN